jgi:hypothetical protein
MIIVNNILIPIIIFEITYIKWATAVEVEKTKVKSLCKKVEILRLMQDIFLMREQ